MTEVINDLKEQGYTVYGLDNAPGAKGLPAADGELECPIALVLGNEVDGIDAVTKKQLDGLLEIPMSKKKSLNVSVASGVALFALQDY